MLWEKILEEKLKIKWTEDGVYAKLLCVVELCV